MVIYAKNKINKFTIGEKDLEFINLNLIKIITRKLTGKSQYLNLIVREILASCLQKVIQNHNYYKKTLFSRQFL